METSRLWAVKAEMTSLVAYSIGPSRAWHVIRPLPALVTQLSTAATLHGCQRSVRGTVNGPSLRLTVGQTPPDFRPIFPNTSPSWTVASNQTRLLHGIASSHG